MTTATTPPENRQDPNAIIYAGLIGVSVAGVYEIFGELHHWADYRAMCCFAVAVPFLIIRFLMIRLETPSSSRWVRRVCGLFDLFGLGGAVAGFSCIIGSFCDLAMYLFWGAGMLALVLLQLSLWADRSKKE